MTAAQRHQILLDLLAQTGFVTVEQVISRLGISPATARRDINKLDESGKLKKVRNGAEAISEQRPRWSPMNIHQAQNHDEKVRIARAASQLVNPGESIVINCGSTAFLLGQELCGKPVQIITNYLPLANYLIDQEHDSVIIMGGQYNRSHSITLSPQGSENSLYAGHWMFTSGKGLTAEGLYKTDMLTAMAEQKMLNVVGKLAVLVDSSKVGERAGMLFSQARSGSVRSPLLMARITGPLESTRLFTSRAIGIINSRNSRSVMTSTASPRRPNSSFCRRSSKGHVATTTVAAHAKPRIKG